MARPHYGEQSAIRSAAPIRGTEPSFDLDAAGLVSPKEPKDESVGALGSLLVAFGPIFSAQTGRIERLG